MGGNGRHVAIHNAYLSSTTNLKYHCRMEESERSHIKRVNIPDLEVANVIGYIPLAKIQLHCSNKIIRSLWKDFSCPPKKKRRK